MADGERKAFLAEAADYYYSVCELYEDDIDPDDHVAVLKRAFSASNCDDFSWVLHGITGWQVVEITWQVPDWGFGHHTMVRAPDGRLLDVNGFSTEAAACKRCDRRKAAEFKVADVEPRLLTEDMLEADDEGKSEELTRLLGVIRSLPHKPFCSEDFREMSMRPFPGVDIPFGESGPSAPRI